MFFDTVPHFFSRTSLMWEKSCHKPPMTGNGKHTTYENGDDWGLVYCCFTHIVGNHCVQWVIFFQIHLQMGYFLQLCLLVYWRLPVFFKRLTRHMWKAHGETCFWDMIHWWVFRIFQGFQKAIWQLNEITKFRW